MATLCGAVVATDSFAACDAGYTAITLDPDIEPTDYSYTAGEWTVTAPYGTLSGITTCNSTAGSWSVAYPQYNFEQGTTGVYCWCRMLRPSRSAWVYHNEYSSASGCASDCAHNCGSSVRAYDEFRRGVFGSITEDICVANTINVNWQNASGTTGSSSSCTYDGTLTAPAAAPEKRGYTFTGWVAQ